MTLRLLDFDLVSDVMRKVKSLNNYPTPIVDQVTGCHRWQGPLNTRHGYGMACGTTAHRMVWIDHHGPIPIGLVIDHVWERGCRYRDCVNIDHLELVTVAENNRRAWRKRKIANGIDDWQSVGSTPPAKGLKIKANGDQRRAYVQHLIMTI